jgi:outer membrane protein assembly factor BamB
VLWGNRIFLTSTDEKGHRILFLCVRAEDGEVLWKKEFPFTAFPQHKFNSFASSTPATDAQHVYVAWMSLGHYKIMAFRHNGEIAWEKDLGPFVSQHGPGTSPIVYEDQVILVKDSDTESYMLSLDSETGAERWKAPLQGKMADYSTPCMYEAPDGRPLLIFNSLEAGIAAFQPRDGRKVWEYASAFDKRSVSSPVLASGLLIGSCGSGGGGNYLVAVRPGDSRGEKQPELAYEIRRAAPYVPTSVGMDDLLFLWGDGGIVTCLHAPSGDVRWQERVGGNFFGSPVWVDGRIFCVSASGEVVVIQAADRFEVLARNPLNELAHTTPAVAGGRMYVRTAGHLYSVGGGEPAGNSQ